MTKSQLIQIRRLITIETGKAAAMMMGDYGRIADCAERAEKIFQQLLLSVEEL